MPFALFEFKCMPFGLRNAAQTFKRFIDQVLHVHDFVFAHCDEVIINSKNAQNQLLDQFGIILSMQQIVNLARIGYHFWIKRFLQKA